MAKNRLRFPVVLHESVSSESVSQSVNKNTSILQHVTYKVLIHEGFKKFDIVVYVPNWYTFFQYPL